MQQWYRTNYIAKYKVAAEYSRHISSSLIPDIPLLKRELHEYEVNLHYAVFERIKANRYSCREKT